MSSNITSRKIDFFSGLHGNYLELVINHSIDQNPYDISQPQFNENGACHIKNNRTDYTPITTAGHYSFTENYQFSDDDWITRIVPTQADMLIAVTNSFLRGADQCLDINTLDINTTEKLKMLPKLTSVLDDLTCSYGVATSYKRNILRHHFNSMFAIPKHGLDMFTDWKSAKHVNEFKFSSFFYFDQFFESLQAIARFTNLEFRPSSSLVALHSEFLEKNHGWNSHLKCSKIIESIIKKEIVPLDLNILEEAWIAYKISQIFNLYDLECCTREYFPTTTEDIIEEIDKGLVC